MIHIFITQVKKTLIEKNNNSTVMGLKTICKFKSLRHFVERTARRRFRRRCTGCIRPRRGRWCWSQSRSGAMCLCCSWVRHLCEKRYSECGKFGIRMVHLEGGTTQNADGILPKGRKSQFDHPIKKIKRGCKGNITCIPFVRPNVQFERAFLVAQPEVFVLGISGEAFVIPKVHPQDPWLNFVLDQGEHALETKPVIIWRN